MAVTVLIDGVTQPEHADEGYSIVIVVLLLVGAAVMAVNQLSASQLMKPNVTAPGFVSTKLEGGTVSSDDSKGGW